MEKFLFKKIEMWVVLILMVFGFVGLILFGAAVRNETKGYNKFGGFGTASNALAEIPATFQLLLNPDLGLVAYGGQRFQGQVGWQLGPTATGLEGYLLLSRFDGNRENHVVELVDLSNFETIHEWVPDAATLLADVELDARRISRSDLTNDRYRIIHPLLMENGDLIIKDHQAPLMRVNSCTQRVWFRDEDLYHHSSAIGPDGTIWVSSHLAPIQVEGVSGTYWDNSLVNIDVDGNEISTKSFTQALLDNGYRHRLFNPNFYHHDAIHINDIEPVPSDGPHWKLGDVFVSMRHISAVALYRPSTNKIIWYREGPWSGQHDVDIVDDHTIAVFNNNAYDVGKGARVIGTNEIVYYDFETDQISIPNLAAFEREDVRTMSEGLFDLMPGGNMMVEEENFGRILIMGEDGTKHAQYINGADDGNVYRLGWSRFIPQELGDRARANLATATCQ